MSPRKMLGKLTVRELHLWAARWEMDPWSEERSDLRAGIIASTIAEVSRSKKHKSTPYKPMDFMPYTLKDKNVKNKELSARIKAAFKGK